MKKISVYTFILFAFTYILCSQTPEQIIKKLDNKKGLAVVIGDKSAKFAISLAEKSDFIIYEQYERDDDVEEARRSADAAGLLGNRIYIEKGNLKKIHLSANLADLLIVLKNKTKIVSKTEIQRVINPLGKAFVGNKIITKQLPSGNDSWSHVSHGSDNVRRSLDKNIQFPFKTQFFSLPHYLPQPDMTVAASGRLFKATGSIAHKKREEAWLNKLYAVNGYNGTILWKRDIPSRFFVPRNTMIATKKRLYFGGDEACIIIDTKTGKDIDKIIISDNPRWKWIGMEKGILYGMVGVAEKVEKNVKKRAHHFGWGWVYLHRGYYKEKIPWGFGKTLVAINPKTKKVLWTFESKNDFDAKCLCIANGNIYLGKLADNSKFKQKNKNEGFITCLNAKNGKIIWHKTQSSDSNLFKKATYRKYKQGYPSWKVPIISCFENNLIINASNLVILDIKNGSMLWDFKGKGYGIIPHEKGLYAFAPSGSPNSRIKSKLFDWKTGKIIEELGMTKHSCAQISASKNSIFTRGYEGTGIWHTDKNNSSFYATHRPTCIDGTTVSDGHIYFWPWVCDCNIAFYGMLGMAPMKNMKTCIKADDKRLEYSEKIQTKNIIKASLDDWPKLRKDNKCLSTTNVKIAKKSTIAWSWKPKQTFIPTQPISVNGNVYISGSDGIVRAFDSETGKEKWKAYTGGEVKIAPTFWNGCVYVGSGDGWAYCFDAASGKLLWRFLTAPYQQKITMYGKLISRWPAATGVLIDKGIAYIGSGMTYYDGTYIYALDALTGKLKWQNVSSGEQNKTFKAGASVQGPFLLNNNILYMPGGSLMNAVRYNIKTGECLNKTVGKKVGEALTDKYGNARGWELSLAGEKVWVTGQAFYLPEQFKSYEGKAFEKTFIGKPKGYTLSWSNDSKLVCYSGDIKLKADSQKNWDSWWGRFGLKKSNPEYDNHKAAKTGWNPKKYSVPKFIDIDKKPLWSFDCPGSQAIVFCKNTVIMTISENGLYYKSHLNRWNQAAKPKKTTNKIIAINIKTGKTMWEHKLPAKPVRWGVAVDAKGRIITTLENGELLCVK